MRLIYLSSILAILLYSVSTQSSDLSHSWFKPTLDINDSEVCQALVQHTLMLWEGRHSYLYPTDGFQEIQMYEQDVNINGKVVYIDQYRHKGCGGACETYQLVASETPFPSRKDNPDFYSSLLARSPPKASIVSILKGGSGSYYGYIPGDNNDELYALTETATWNLVCSLNKRPQELDIDKIRSDYTAVKSLINELQNLVGGLRRGAGSCGSMATHHRWTQKSDEEFSRLLYAPRLEDSKTDSFNNSSYDNDMGNLEIWALKGLSEYNAFMEFESLLPKVINELAEFYRKNFQWEKIKAREFADYAVKYAISSGIRFGDKYQPFSSSSEITIRKEILEKQPIDIIKRIDKSALENIRSHRIGKYLVHSAVDYPEALDFLLNEGFDPNLKNGFNKTALMYAAQYNNFESVKILLSHGAIVNSGTIIPDDRCNYTIKTSNMSPLHYAVRYASRDVIDHLLDNGASIYSIVRNQYNYPYSMERPIDWLSRFDNQNLSPADKKHIQSRLTLPNREALKKLTLEKNLLGESLYAKQDYGAAFKLFSEATQIDKNDVRALNNLAVTSLKLGKTEGSLQASMKVLSLGNINKKQKASSLYNIGLACESVKKRNFFYDGIRYCQEDALGYFVKAFENYPTKSRAKTIVERFNKQNKSQFICKREDALFDSVYKTGDHIFFLHSKQNIDIPDTVEYLFHNSKSKEIEKKPYDIKRASFIDLSNGYFVSTYSVKKVNYQVPFAINNKICSRSTERLINKDDKLIYIQAPDKGSEIRVEFNLDYPYTIILSGKTQWFMTETGTQKSEYIVNNGTIDDNNSEIKKTLIENLHTEWTSEQHKNKRIDNHIEELIGKVLYTKFKINSKSIVRVTDEDIKNMHLSTDPFPVYFSN